MQASRNRSVGPGRMHSGARSSMRTSGLCTARRRWSRSPPGRAHFRRGSRELPPRVSTSAHSGPRHRQVARRPGGPNAFFDSEGSASGGLCGDSDAEGRERDEGAPCAHAAAGDPPSRGRARLVSSGPLQGAQGRQAADRVPSSRRMPGPWSTRPPTISSHFSRSCSAPVHDRPKPSNSTGATWTCGEAGRR